MALTEVDPILIPNVTSLPLVGHKLPVPYFEQEQTEWCWAACMKMVFRFSDLSDTRLQCDLAERAFGPAGCCATPCNSRCNKPLPVTQVSTEWSKNGYASLYNSSPLGFAIIQREVSLKKVVEAGLKWKGGRGHAVIIIGWAMVNATEWVDVLDPKKGKGILTITYNELLSAYGEGSWRWSWNGIAE